MIGSFKEIGATFVLTLIIREENFRIIDARLDPIFGEILRGPLIIVFFVGEGIQVV